MDKAIGVFDSGIGGLTVVRELISALPNERIIYFGDTARVPYGGKSTSTIRKFSAQIVDFLLKKGVKLIVTACNTVSATSLEWLKQRYRVPIIGVIEPGAHEAVRITKNSRIGVIGTRATIESQAYKVAIHSLATNINVYSKSCPLLVPIIEEWSAPLAERSNSEVVSTTGIVRLILDKYLVGLKKNGIDTLILGCTHYPIIKELIQQVVGDEVKIIDSASAVAAEVQRTLHDAHRTSHIAHHTFYFSDIPRGFRQLSKKFVGFHISYTRIAI